MDKEKQIEEMEQDLAKYIPQFWSNNLYFDCANALYNAGYRKISEGAVVLTKFEYDEMFADVTASKKKLARIIDSAKSKGQKETAKEILQMFDDQNIITWDELKRTIKQRYGVEAEE